MVQAPAEATDPETRNRIISIPLSKAAKSSDVPLRQNIESVTVSSNGGVLITGWIDDSAAPVDCIKVSGADWRLTLDGAALARTRRHDVEDALGKHIVHSFGYFGFIFSGQTIDPNGELKVEICTRDGRSATKNSPADIVNDLTLRDKAMWWLVGVQHFGHPQARAIASLDGGLGRQILDHNRSITDRIVRSPYVRRFGPGRTRHLGSIVVCLYGKVEFLFIQNALFSAGPGIEDYEFIYICNSPELADPILREAEIGSAIYGIDQTVAILPGNAGFGGANNAAARLARTNRILFVNPDVFPHDRDWAAKHTAIVKSLPREQTRLFGASLYYDDGSLMHGGMYFEMDRGVSVEGDKATPWRLARVEHYGKGAPPDTARFIAARPVPAVTGAFISCERGWFEELGGFTEDYLFGNYEDADLGLKSLKKGCAPWLQDLKLWHLEGKGSTRVPVQEGGFLVNRWLFTATWGDIISECLSGQDPILPPLPVEKARRPVDLAADKPAGEAGASAPEAGSIEEFLKGGIPVADVAALAGIEELPQGEASAARPREAGVDGDVQGGVVRGLPSMDAAA